MSRRLVSALRRSVRSAATLGAAPRITSTASLSGLTGVAYHYDADDTATATGTSPITFSKVVGPAEFSISSAGLITWTPASDDSTTDITIRATNAFGYYDQAFVVDVGTIPVITSTANLVTTVAEAYHYDADDTAAATGTAPITWTKQSGPDEFSISGAGLVTWTPPSASNPTITIRATNAYGYDEEVFQVEVSDVPVITSTGATSAIVEQAYAYDADSTAVATGGSITWSVEDADGTDFAIHPSTGTITWTPDIADFGAKTIVIRATNAQGFDEETININVTSTLLSIGNSGSNANYYASDVGAGYRGHDSVMSYAAVVKYNSNAASDGVIYAYALTTASTDAFFLKRLGSGASPSGAFQAVINPGGAAFSIDGPAYVANDAGKIHTIVVTIEPALGTDKTMRMYHNGAEHGNVRVNATFTPSALHRHHILNLTAQSSQATGVTVLSAHTSNATLTATQVKAWHESVIAMNHGTVVPSITGEQNKWVSSDATAIPTTWEDATGTADLTKAGTPVLDGPYANTTLQYTMIPAFTFTGGAHWSTLNHSIGKGSTTMSIGVLAYKGQNAGPAVVETYAGYRDVNIQRGWTMRRETNSNINYFVYNSTPTLVATPSQGSGNSNIWNLHVFTWDATTIRHWVNGTEISSGTAATTYTTPTSADYLFIGNLPGNTTFPLRRSSIAGVAFLNGVTLSDTNIDDWWAAIQAANDMVAPPSHTPDEWWKASSNTGLGNWNGEIGGAGTVLTKTGSPILTYHRAIYA